MPNPSDQPNGSGPGNAGPTASDRPKARPMRVVLSVLVLAVAFGLWYLSKPSDPPDPSTPSAAGDASGAVPAEATGPATPDPETASTGDVPQGSEPVTPPAADGAATPDPATAQVEATGPAATDPATTQTEATGSATPDPATTRAEATGSATPDPATTRAEAEQFVESLTETTPPTVPVDRAAHFVTPEHVISLVPEDTIKSVSVAELARDETLDPDSPITIVHEVEQIETAAPEQLIAESGGDLDRLVTVLTPRDDPRQDAAGNGSDQDVDAPDPVAAPDSAGPGEPVVERSDSVAGPTDSAGLADSVTDPTDSVAGPTDSVAGPTDSTGPVVERITVREALGRLLDEPDAPLSIIRTVRHFEVMTLRELLESAGGDDVLLNVVAGPWRIESATLAELLQRKKAENPDAIFYLHTVLPTDEQGIWGIVHFALIDNFARGMAIRRGEDIGTYTVRIPRHADERLDDRSSSFLGKLIDQKTRESYVYNYREHRMGRSPDHIFPGQEIVIIDFDPGELIAIYTHFAAG